MKKTTQKKAEETLASDKKSRLKLFTKDKSKSRKSLEEISRIKNYFSQTLLTLFAMLTLTACGSDQPVTQESPLSETFKVPNKKAIYGKTPLECSSGTALTWGSFGQFFFEKYCTSCHSKYLDESARGGTPMKSNFDTHQDITIYRTKILELAGKKIGAKMPPSDIVPLDERTALIEYLNCGAPP